MPSLCLNALTSPIIPWEGGSTAEYPNACQDGVGEWVGGVLGLTVMGGGGVGKGFSRQTQGAMSCNATKLRGYMLFFFLWETSKKIGD